MKTLDPQSGSRRYLQGFGLGLASWLVWSGGAMQSQRPQVPADELVREVVARELKAAHAPGHYMYLLRQETPRGSKTEEMIETKDWLIGRVIRIDGKLLTPAQGRKEDERLTRLITDTSELRKEREKQQKEEQRVHKLFRALPDAFHYEYVGSEKSESGAEVVRLKFHPDAHFDPPTQELRVLKGMEGTVLIDASAERILRIAARLTKRVNFAWGFLAHLDPGGTFLLEQGNLGHGRWQITNLAVRLTGRMLLVEHLDIDFRLTTSNFRRMPDALTLKEGLELLREQDRMNGADQALAPNLREKVRWQLGSGQGRFLPVAQRRCMKGEGERCSLRLP